jgi:hypothetical protein
VNPAKSLAEYLKMPALDEGRLAIHRIVIPFREKEDIRDELAAIQIPPFRVFGDLNSLSKTIVRRLAR